jgi:hypothetical protein
VVLASYELSMGIECNRYTGHISNLTCEFNFALGVPMHLTHCMNPQGVMQAQRSGIRQNDSIHLQTGMTDFTAFQWMRKAEMFTFLAAQSNSELAGGRNLIDFFVDGTWSGWGP